jgi:tRNA/tmRNA/rRNA uracil-C5-methylase (TrmA/RlmC/RlmD family)
VSDGVVEVEVRGIASSGDGVATLEDGRTVFIPRAAPGDRLRLRSLRLHKRFARAEIGEILAHGAGRATPPCPHYIRDRCGSCQLMHLDAATQRAVKGRIAGDALRRIGKLDLPDPDVIAAPSQLGYRAKITHAVSGGRMGYHPLGNPDRVLDIRDCLIAEPAVRQLHQAVRGAMSLLPPDATRVVFRRDQQGGLHVVVRTDGEGAWVLGRQLHLRLEKAGVTATVWWHPEGGAPRAVAGGLQPWPATVFEQVHPAMGRMVREAALRSLGDVQGKHAWDLYAGIGETTVALLERGATVDSIELDRRAVEQAERLGPAGPKRRVGTVEERIAELRPAAVVITNPPRTGMEPAAADALTTSGAARIAYISCDAATLARDLARMQSAYAVTWVQAFDQFPQTAHLECVALLEKR